MGEINRVAVIGTGPSVKLFTGEQPIEFDTTIGVNDVWKYVKTNVLVVLNPEKDFTPDRLKIIKDSHPCKFFSQIVNWDYRNDFRQIRLRPGYPDLILRLKGPEYEKSYCSPFVAVQIAYREYYADEIHLFGIDMTNHPHLNGELCAKIRKHFTLLKRALAENNCQMVVHGQGILSTI